MFKRIPWSGSKKKRKNDIYKDTMFVSRISMPVVLTLALALLLRLGFAFVSPNSIPDWRDSHHYHHLAENIAGGNGYIDETGSWLTEPVYSDQGKTSFWLPGYPLFLAGVMKLFGSSPRTIYIAQALLGFALVLVVYLAVAFQFNRRTAFLAMLFCTLSPMQIHQTTTIASEGLCAFLMVLLLAVLWKWESAISERQTVSWRWPILLAVCMGAGILTRSIFVPIALTAFLYLSVMIGRQPNVSNSMSRTTNILIALLITFAIVSPWLIRNYILWGDFVYQTKTGINFLIGFNEKATGGFSLEGVPALDPEQTSEISRDAFYKEAAWNWIKKHLGKSTMLFLKKMVLFYNPLPSTVHGVSGILLFCWSAILLLLAIAGVLFGCKYFSKLAFVFIILATYTITHGAAFSISRFRVPIEPLLAILAAYGVDSILRYTSSRPRK